VHRIYFFMFLAALPVTGCSSSETREKPSRTTDSSDSETPLPDLPQPAAASDDRPIILAFGDSLTAGSGLPPGSGYPEMLQAELDRRGYKYHVVNAGIGGDTTTGGLARLKDALALRPKFVILELGANDGLRGLPLRSMEANLDEMITEFKKHDVQVLLAGMTLPRNFGPEYIGAFEKVFPALAEKHRVTLIPFFLEGAAGKTELNLEDGIHPNADGYRLVTTNVLKYLEPLLK
jgi:acyl-CoA thioesterase-1